MSSNRPEVGTWWKDKNTNTIYYCIGSSTYNGGIALEDTNSNMRLVHSLEYFDMNFEWLPQCHCFSWKPIPADQWPKFYVLVSGRSLFSYAKQSHQYCDSLCVEYDGTVSHSPFKDHDVQKWLSTGKWREVTIADANGRVRNSHRLTTTEMSDIMAGKPLPCPTVASDGYVFTDGPGKRYGGDQYWDYTTGVWAEYGTGIWATGTADYDRINDGPWQRKLSSIEHVPVKVGEWWVRRGCADPYFCVGRDSFGCIVMERDGLSRTYPHMASDVWSRVDVKMTQPQSPVVESAGTVIGAQCEPVIATMIQFVVPTRLVSEGGDYTVRCVRRGETVAHGTWLPVKQTSDGQLYVETPVLPEATT